MGGRPFSWLAWACITASTPAGFCWRRAQPGSATGARRACLGWAPKKSCWLAGVLSWAVARISFLCGNARPSPPSVRSVAAPPHELLAAAQVKGYVLWTVLNGRSLYDFFADRSGINVGRVVTPDGDTRVGSYVASQQPVLLSSLLTGSLTPYCILGLLVGMWWVRPPPELQALGVFLACLAACVLVVQGALRGHHFVLFVPFVQAFLAAGLLFFARPAA